MSNPYQSPSADFKYPPGGPGYAPPPDTGFGAVNQVRIFAVLNGVQGMLELPLGLMTASMGVILPAMMKFDQQNNQRPGQPPPEEFLWVMTGFYLAVGIPTILGGILRLFAAWSNFRFRRRTVGILSVCFGLVSVFSCYCAPTGIGILIYGLILLLNPAVKHAFELGDQGQPSDQILASFLPYRPPPQWPPPTGFG
jgi:hypothetical protein